jgi:hypothetical protein
VTFWDTISQSARESLVRNTNKSDRSFKQTINWMGKKELGLLSLPELYAKKPFQDIQIASSFPAMLCGFEASVRQDKPDFSINLKGG